MFLQAILKRLVLVITHSLLNMIFISLHCSCFIGDLRVLFGAFLAPIAAILMFNSVLFVIVARTALKHRRKKAETKGTSTISLILRLIGVTFLLGLTWVFGGLTVVRETSLAFQILFAIFNSSQGFFLFLFFCVLNNDARESWRRILFRGRYKQPLPSSAQRTSHFRGRHPQVLSGGTRSTSQGETIRNAVLGEKSRSQIPPDVELSAIEEADEIAAVAENSTGGEILGNKGSASGHISTGVEMAASGEVYENPVAELTAGEGNGGDGITSEGADQISMCSEVVEIVFEENPTPSATDASPESGVGGITVIENHHADGINRA